MLAGHFEIDARAMIGQPRYLEVRGAPAVFVLGFCHSNRFLHETGALTRSRRLCESFAVTERSGIGHPPGTPGSSKVPSRHRWGHPLLPLAP